MSKVGMLQAITMLWFTKGFSTAAEKDCEKCLICAINNIGPPVCVDAAVHSNSMLCQFCCFFVYTNGHMDMEVFVYMYMLIY